MNSARPTVSIILPTYNRARFLPEAIQSIRDQQFTDWELIVVDDGSTDETPELIKELTAAVRQSVQYIWQENQGAYAARNTGLDQASGKYIAFFDSDDLWLPHHLQDCVDALESNPDVDWVYGSCQIVEDSTGEVTADNTFYQHGQPRAFMSLHVRNAGRLQIIDDDDVLRCTILHGLYCGLQNSVLRRELFGDVRFEFESRNEAEDQLFVIRSLRHGRTIAYFNRVHVVYKVHATNSSAVRTDGDFERKSRVLRTLAAGYEKLLAEPCWRPIERRALRRRLQQEYFWKLAYSTLSCSGQQQEAMQMFRRGLKHWPWNWRCWKTYVLAQARRFASRH